MWGRLACLRFAQRTVSSVMACARISTESLEYMAHAVSAVVEADRVLPYTTPDDPRVQPLLKRAKENLEMSLEADDSNTDAMLLLSRLHMYYRIPGGCLSNGAALLEAAAKAGNSVAQYELACRLRAEGVLLNIGDDGMDEMAFHYLELAACKKHPGALFLMGATYLAGIHTKQDLKAAAWCFRNAADQGHVAAATVYASLLLKGLNVTTTGNEGEAEQQQIDDQQGSSSSSSGDSCQKREHDSEEMVSVGGSEELGENTGVYEQDKEKGEQVARYYFEQAAQAGDGVALEWLTRISWPSVS